MLDADEGQRRRVPVVLQRATADAEDPANGLAGQQFRRFDLRSEQFAHAFAQPFNAAFQRLPCGRFDDNIVHNHFISWGYSSVLSDNHNCKPMRPVPGFFPSGYPARHSLPPPSFFGQ